jgi:hypothetical protein
MTGQGVIDDAFKWGRNKAGDAVQWAANKGIDYVGDFAKGKVGNVAKRIRGDGFLRKLASGAVRGIGNIAADTIGGQVKPKRKRARKTQGRGFLRKLASGAVRGIGNIAANAIGGDLRQLPLKRVRKPINSKLDGNGLVAPGMKY